MQDDEELVVVGCAEGQEWPMQEVQAPSWEVQVSIQKHVASSFAQAAPACMHGQGHMRVGKQHA